MPDMEKKIVSQYTDPGFGFPVVLENVPMVKVRGRWTPNINYNELALDVLRELVALDGRLTGNQVKFIRNHFEMTLQAFATRFGVSHPAVLKWERAGEKPTGMTWSTEKDLRLFVKKLLKSNASAFLMLYSRLEKTTEFRPGKITVDASKLAA